MPRIDGNRVSRPWFDVLTAARQSGVKFKLNEGRRTMAEQWFFWRRYKRQGSPIAAYPSPWAPHIRVGRVDHALDVQDEDLDRGNRGGADRLILWAASQGFTLRKTVASEPWHLEIVGGGRALRRFAAKVGPPQYTRAERRTVRLLRKLRGRPSTRARRAAIRAAKRTLLGYRAAIRAAAKTTGWDKHDRRRRYRGLLKEYKGRG